MSWYNDRQFIRFVITFLVLFLVFYLGTQFWIGLAAPGGLYSPFVEHHLDYISWIKKLLMKGAAFVASWFGYDTIEEPGYLVRVVGKRGVIIACDCVGYGVYSFWAALMLAYQQSWKRKLIWIILGLLLLYTINQLRIGLLLVAINKGWKMPLGWDHHTWFNIVAYGAILIMLFFFGKAGNNFTAKN